MKRRSSMTASELMAQLHSDPQFQRARAEREERFARLEAECAADEAPLVAQLRHLGLDVDSVWDLVNNTPHPVLPRRFVGPYAPAYALLVQHLAEPHHPKIREGVIRALTRRDADATARAALLRELAAEPDQMLRWVLANALRTMIPKREHANFPHVQEAYRSGGGV
jgi:hypothetical protein